MLKSWLPPKSNQVLRPDTVFVGEFRTSVKGREGVRVAASFAMSSLWDGEAVGAWVCAALLRWSE